MIARQHVLQILIRVFQELQPTAHLMRSEALYEYGRTAATDVWDAIFATYNAKSDFVCNQTMALLKLHQQFDGTNFLGMQADLNSLLAQIAVDKISICDPAAMCLVVGSKMLAFENPFSATHTTKLLRLNLPSTCRLCLQRLRIIFLLCSHAPKTPLTFLRQTPTTSRIQPTPTSQALLAM